MLPTSGTLPRAWTPAARDHQRCALPLNRKSVVARTNCTHGIRPTAATAGCAGRLAFRFAAARPEDGAADERILTRGKANYAKSGDETAVRLFYADGVGSPGTDITALLKKHNIPLTFDMDAISAALTKLPQAAKDEIMAANAATIDDTGGYPMWSII